MTDFLPMKEFIKTFNDWRFWMTQDIFNSNDIDFYRNTDTSIFIDGKSYQVFWKSVNLGAFDMFWEQLDT